MSSFDVRVFAIRRRSGRRVFEVRWRVTNRNKSRSFITRALPDSYRAELVRAARQGQAFGPATGEPTAWVTPEPVIVSGRPSPSGSFSRRLITSGPFPLVVRV
jgi:hypothetical protein